MDAEGGSSSPSSSNTSKNIAMAAAAASAGLVQRTLPFAPEPTTLTKRRASTSSTLSTLSEMSDDGILTLPPPSPESKLKQLNGKAGTAKKGARPSDASEKPPKKKPKKTETSTGAIDGKGKGKTNAKTGEVMNKQPKVVAARGEGSLCHQHRAQCITKLIRCTFLRDGKSRCAAKYCKRTLQTVYDQDIDAILQAGKNLPGVDASQHCSSDEAKYIWKCPRCRGACKCSMCRKKKGLEPLGRLLPNGDTSAAKSTTGDKAKKTPKPKAEAKPKAELQNSAAEAKPKPKPKTLPLTRQSSLPRLRKEPKAVPPPVLEKIATRLQPANVFARIWLYETLVRFDVIRTPKAVLSQLDRFDNWTSRHMQVLLDRMLCTIAGLQNIQSGQPARHTGAAVRAFREHGGKLQRGEPWEAAKALLERKDIVIQALPEIEHPNDDDEDESTPEPPGPRMTRGRSNAEDVAIQRAKQESLAESNSNRSTPETAASSEAVTTVIPPPPFEDKVAILVGLAELVMETGDVAEELKVSAENLAATERDGKTEMAQLEKEWNEQLKEISKKAPSIVSEEYKAWKEERREAEMDFKWRALDVKVHHQLVLNSLKLRTGPLGVDTDGTEYWALAEFNEKMPNDTTGRWAWSLIAYGKPFFAPPSAPAQTGQQPNGTGDGAGVRDGAKTSAAAKLKSSSLTAEIKEFAKEGEDSSSSFSSTSSLSPEPSPEPEKASKASPESAAAALKPTVPGPRRATEQGFYGTNDPYEIRKLMGWIKYRLEVCEYEDERRMAGLGGAFGSAGSAALSAPAPAPAPAASITTSVSPSTSAPTTAAAAAAAAAAALHALAPAPAPPSSPTKISRKQKESIKEDIALRRTGIEELCAKLGTVREYFCWHLEDLCEIFGVGGGAATGGAGAGPEGADGEGAGAKDADADAGKMEEGA